MTLNAALTIAPLEILPLMGLGHAGHTYQPVSPWHAPPLPNTQNLHAVQPNTWECA